jgi:transposase InsO family protein
MLRVSRSGFYAWKDRPASARALRHLWLAGEITDAHRESGGIYGERRVAAELRHGRGIVVNRKTVTLLMRRLGLYGLPQKRLPKGAKVGKFAATDLVRREFTVTAPNRLWMTDITEHPTREGKVYCCVVLDAFSRKVVGWSIDTQQNTLLVTSALTMATHERNPSSDLVIHSDRGTQFTSWAFSQKVRDTGFAPSMGAIGTPHDNAMVESFWGRMQVELLNRKRWQTRVELAAAIQHYIENFHNHRRRHSALNMLTPTEYENRYQSTIAA